tara:strand:+ start:47 stop:889 length:843 start_codon:yes stop_codon:yes gene_type:complete
MLNIINKMMPSRSRAFQVDSNGTTEPLHNKDSSIYDSFINSEIPTILKQQGLLHGQIENRIKEIMATAKKNKWNIDKIIDGLEWINSKAVSSKGIIVTNNSIEYGIYTYKNHKGINGFRSNLPNSPIIFGECIYDIEISGMANLMRVVEAGRFEWISQLQDMGLVDGKATFSNGTAQEGKFECNTKVKKMLLVDGKMTYSNGDVDEGKFEYNIKIKAAVLVEGTKKLSNGQDETGKFEYNTKLKKMVLVEGTKKLSNGQDETGKFEYDTELKKMVLVSEK